MKERIKQIMDQHDMTPARFADTLGVGRAVISHILNGRNNPSLEIVTRILTKIPNINSEWLLTGNGSMYKNKQDDTAEKTLSLFPEPIQQNTLPTENPIITNYQSEIKKEAKEEVVKQAEKTIQPSEKEQIIYKEIASKKIKQIIVYYSDNTFESFSQDNNV